MDFYFVFISYLSANSSFQDLFSEKANMFRKEKYKDSDIALPQYLLEKHKHNEALDQPLVFKSDLLLIDATLDSIPQLR